MAAVEWKPTAISISRENSNGQPINSHLPYVKAGNRYTAKPRHRKVFDCRIESDTWYLTNTYSEYLDGNNFLLTDKKKK